MTAVADVEEVLLRQRDQAFVEHGQAADAGVKESDRPGVFPIAAHDTSGESPSSSNPPQLSSARNSTGFSP